ncbi:MAG: glycosyltransferase [Candidatus Viridilinea halotolerans]|uniref:Glycosyltransferase n=1 Tax=Candidatus Viridilinea halotolerans TaxID=2491704 RepID=A0A426U1M1_9CHLR|nr:MAG: glycosyltransferase [Candidatus Viridilinea halotolerans]
MITTPHISVVIPTYNRRAQLQNTLACLERQTYPAEAYEIIVVDDGSQDGTAEDLALLAAQGRLRYLCQANQGPGAARNAGVQLAHGAILAFTDTDCLPATDWLQQLATSYQGEAGAARVAVGGRVVDVVEGRWLQDFAAVHMAHLANHAEHPRYLDTANASFRRSIFLALGGFNTSFARDGGEDVDFSLRLVARGYQLERNPDALVHHVGRSSLHELMIQAWVRGCCDAALLLHYPQLRSGLSKQGFRNFVRMIILKISTRVGNIQGKTGLFLRIITTTLFTLLYSIPLIEYITKKIIPRQYKSYQDLNIGTSRLIIYMLLSSIFHLIRLAGEITAQARMACNEQDYAALLRRYSGEQKC